MVVETKYRCIEKFCVDLRDENESLVENERFVIEVNSEGVLEGRSSLSECRLTNKCDWLEVPREVFERYFVQA